VVNEELRWIFQPFTPKQIPSAESSYYNILSADGKFWGCILVLAAWLAD